MARERSSWNVVEVLRQSRGALDATYPDAWAGRLGLEALMARARTEAG